MHVTYTDIPTLHWGGHYHACERVRVRSTHLMEEFSSHLAQKKFSLLMGAKLHFLENCRDKISTNVGLPILSTKKSQNNKMMKFWEFFVHYK